MQKKISIVCVVFLALLLTTVALANLLQPNRPTYSEDELRELETMPEFSLSALADGSYFSGVGKFVSDTFVCRQFFMQVSRNFEKLYGPEGRVNIIESPTTDTRKDEEISVPSVTTKERPATSEPATTPPASDTQEPPVQNVLEIRLSAAQTSVSQGESLEIAVEVIYAPDSTQPEALSVTSSAPDVLSAAVSGDKIIVTGVSAGSAMITVQSESGVFAQMSLTVLRSAGTDTSHRVDDPYRDEADFLPNGMVIYNGAVYAGASYGPKTSQSYADTLAYYADLFPQARVNCLIAPISSAFVDDDAVRNHFNDQSKIISKIYEKMPSTVTTIDAYGKLYEHRTEYTYFKSDHHWTQLGAYYAYVALVEKLGMTPTSLEEFTRETLSTDYIGSMYNYTKDERVKTFYDTVDAYIPTKPHTMTVYSADGSTVVRQYDSSILTGNRNYLAFLGGDKPYAVINVPSNPQDKTVMVIKDSYGNAFVPYLTENYGNIIVVDPRYVQFNIYEALKDYPLTDIVFCTNIYNPNTVSFVKNCLRIVGQS